MENFLKHFLDVLTDKTISLSRRTITILLLILSIYVINDTFSFSFNYRIDKKINQLKLINEIYPVGLQDSIKLKSNLDKIVSEITERETITTTIKKTLNNIIKGNLFGKQRVVVLKFLSGTFVFLILLIIFTFTEKDKKQLNLIYWGLTIMAISLNILLLLIPTFEPPLINYILNISLSVLSIILVTAWGNRIK